MLEKKISQGQSRDPCRLAGGGGSLTPTWLSEVLFSLPMMDQGASVPQDFTRSN